MRTGKNDGKNTLVCAGNPISRSRTHGTEKVIQEHSTIGIVITTDGSFGEIARENFVPAEEQTVAELKTQGKPFLIVVNSQIPYKEAAQKRERAPEEISGNCCCG